MRHPGRGGWGELVAITGAGNPPNRQIPRKGPAWAGYPFALLMPRDSLHAMSKGWLNTQTDSDVRRRTGAFWTQMRADLESGKFWADDIKRYNAQPDKRLKAALNMLPLPAAFREAAKAVRTIIRHKRKTGENYERNLALLYWLAAIDSFCIPRASRLQEPGFNVMDSVPGDVIRSLSFDYESLGYQELNLLTKTDRKWFAEAWGEPSAHTTVNDLHREVWDKYEDQLIEDRRRGRERFQKDMARILKLK